VLLDLGLKKIRIMTNNPRKLVALAGYGLEVVEEVPLAQAGATQFSRGRLARVT
jgi:GTP cyclohydrolase II